MAGNDGRNGDDVVRIGGMAHPEEETERDNGKKPNHLCQPLTTKTPRPR